MKTQTGISRRQVVGMALTAGGLATAGRITLVWSQSSKRIEQLAPELEKIISPSEPIRDLADGFGAQLPLRGGRPPLEAGQRRIEAILCHRAQP